MAMRKSSSLREAVAAQLSLPYSEPPFWHYPIRQSLGTALLRHGDAEAAEEALRRRSRRVPGKTAGPCTD